MEEILMAKKELKEETAKTSNSEFTAAKIKKFCAEAKPEINSKAEHEAKKINLETYDIKENAQHQKADPHVHHEHHAGSHHHAEHASEHQGGHQDSMIPIWTIILSIAAIIVIALLIINIGKIFPTKTAENVLAKVNGEQIKLEELDAEVAKLPAIYSQMSDKLTLKKTVLEQMIIKRLLMQEAKKLNIEVSDDEVKQKVKEVYEKFSLTQEQFLKKLEEQNIKYEDLVNDYKEQMLLNKLIEAVLVKEKPTDAQITEFYDKNKETLETVKASHILVCFTGATKCAQNRTEQEALTIINNVLSKANSGEDFDKLAKEYSDDPTGETSASLGWFNKGAMVPEFEKVAFETEAGKITQPVKTSFGYHIIKVEEKKTTLEELKDDISTQITNEEVQSKIGIYIDSLKKESKIEYVTPLDMLEPLSEDGKTIDETGAQIINKETAAGITTFSTTSGDICKTPEGKPKVYLFSTTWCPHCKWVKDTFDKVAIEYGQQGKIAPNHWEIDTGDDTLTFEEEKSVPEEDMAIFKEFNPQGSIPTFVFGCKYYRVGNGYEQQDDKAAEEAEFRAVFDELVKESTSTTTPA